LGFNVPEDCNDADPAVSPNATERADGLDVDEDCDGRLACRRDADRDGWGVQAVVLHRGDTCDVPTDQVSSRTGDCDDARAAVHPAAFDAPGDGRDATCDGLDGMRLEVDATTRTLRVRAHHVGPGGAAILTLSTAGPGPGPCPPQLAGACSALLTPRALGTATAGPTGAAAWNLPVPPAIPAGTTVWFEAWRLAGGTAYSTGVTAAVVP
jgi:hypothetical protein